jgi:hypothetical protein
LKKLQGVIESVHGADVHLHLTAAHATTDLSPPPENTHVRLLNVHNTQCDQIRAQESADMQENNDRNSGSTSSHSRPASNPNAFDGVADGGGAKSMTGRDAPEALRAEAMKIFGESKSSMSISEVATFSENSGVGDDKSSDAIEAAEWANHKSDSVFIESQVHGSCGALTAVATHAEYIPYPLDADQISDHAHEQSKESGSSHVPHGNECSSPSSGIGNMPSSVTVKATFEADTVRFKLAFGSSFMELKNEIALRFQFNGRDFDLKYLDDDEEWMLLTCDRDLSECIDVMQSLGGHVIKLLVAMATRT